MPSPRVVNKNLKQIIIIAVIVYVCVCVLLLLLAFWALWSIVIYNNSERYIWETYPTLDVFGETTRSGRETFIWSAR